jgi:hypothetical protein
MLANAPRFLDEIGSAIGRAPPQSIPKSTPTTIAFRYVCEFLTHAIGRLDQWECRNGYCETSGYGCGKRAAWFNSFAGIRSSQPPKELTGGKLHAAYGYWFVLKNTEPVLSIDTAGRLYTLSGEVHDLAAIYAEHKRMWPVIAETAITLLP